MRLELKPLDAPFGARVSGADLNALDDGHVRLVEDALLEYGLLLFPRQAMSDRELSRLSQRFGEVETPANHNALSPDTRHVVYISNLHDASGRPIGGLGNEEVRWHADQAFREHPATLSILYGMHVASHGGTTYWCSTRLGYAALTDALRLRIDGLRGRYRPSAVHTIEKVEVTHPLVLDVPGDRGQALFVSPSTRGIVGMDDDAGIALRDQLLEYQLREAHVYAHHWQAGDVVLYDNGQTLHRRDPFEGFRFMKATRVFVSPRRFPVPD